MTRALLVAVWLALGLSLSAQAAELAPTEAAKIEYLIVSIAALDQAQFIRNGTPQPYRIRFSEGREVDAKEFLNQKLAEYPAPTKPNTPLLEQVQPRWKS